MKYLETKHERKSATITVLLLSILVLLCFVVGQPYMDPPAEYGVALDFGNSSSINNNTQAEPAEPASSSEETEEAEPEEEIVDEVVEEETIEEVVEEEVVEDTIDEEAIEAAEKEAAEAAEAAEKLLTQKAEEALKIKEAKEAKEKSEKEAKEKAEKEAKEKADNAAKAKAEKEAKQKAAKAKADAAAKAAAAKKAADGKAKAAAAAAAAKKAKEGAGNKTVPFSSLEDYPIYPGCEGGDKNTQRKCMNAKLKQFLAENFDKELPSKLGLTGIQDIKIYFIINNLGKVVSIRAKAAKPELVAEAKRVSKLLPKMKPAMQNGKAQAVDYYLPLKIQTGN